MDNDDSRPPEERIADLLEQVLLCDNGDISIADDLGAIRDALDRIADALERLADKHGRL